MAAFLAKQTGRPVKLEYTRHDDFIGVHGRWSTEIDYRMGAKADGTLTAVDMRAISNMGAYMKSTGTVANFERYACPNARSEITRVFGRGIPARPSSSSRKTLFVQRTVDCGSSTTGMPSASARSANWKAGFVTLVCARTNSASYSGSLRRSPNPSRAMCTLRRAAARSSLSIVSGEDGL